MIQAAKNDLNANKKLMSSLKRLSNDIETEGTPVPVSEKNAEELQAAIALLARFLGDMNESLEAHIDDLENE